MKGVPEGSSLETSSELALEEIHTPLLGDTHSIDAQSSAALAVAAVLALLLVPEVKSVVGGVIDRVNRRHDR